MNPPKEKTMKELLKTLIHQSKLYKRKINEGRKAEYYKTRLYECERVIARIKILTK